MYGKPGTKAEVAALKAAATFVRDQGLPFADDLDTLVEKLTAPFRPRKEGPDMPHVQDLLVLHSGGKVIAVAGANSGWWATLSGRSADREVTDENVTRVGKWLAGQPWATGMTVDRVMSGWPSYLARARNEAYRDSDGKTVTRADWEPSDSSDVA